MMGLLKMELNRGKEKYPSTTVIIIKDGGKTTNHMGTAIISSHREIFTMVSFKMEKDMEKVLIHIKMEISIMEIGKMMPSKVRAESQWFRVILIGGGWSGGAKSGNGEYRFANGDMYQGAF